MRNIASANFIYWFISALFAALLFIDGKWYKSTALYKYRMSKFLIQSSLALNFSLFLVEYI